MLQCRVGRVGGRRVAVAHADASRSPCGRLQRRPHRLRAADIHRVRVPARTCLPPRHGTERERVRPGKSERKKKRDHVDDGTRQRTSAVRCHRTSAASWRREGLPAHPRRAAALSEADTGQSTIRRRRRRARARIRPLHARSVPARLPEEQRMRSPAQATSARTSGTDTGAITQKPFTPTSVAVVVVVPPKVELSAPLYTGARNAAGTSANDHPTAATVSANANRPSRCSAPCSLILPTRYSQPRGGAR